MSSKIFDGRALSKVILQELKQEILHTQAIKSVTSVPKLAYVYMGTNKSVLTYLGIKHRACDFLGIQAKGYQFKENAPVQEVMAQINELNQDKTLSGILIQLPLADGIDTQQVMDCIDVTKDVDGLHSMNIGKVALRGLEPLYYPCTPLGCIEILKRNNIQIQGKHAVVIGRSNLAGTPLALLLQKQNATVTICHKYTNDVSLFTKQADILAVAVGKPEFIKRNMVKPGAIVVDIGINEYNGKLVGDVHSDVAEVSSFFTPVPGGVGPMTVAMLMTNLVKSWNFSLSK
ncbi:hypothetical protein SteCoe_4719 [Stentor coeruleus]|uniref:Uncharacterized protein n=1 Tax=Stentor coeruleus TaxID=5963 RepID=A0A1R2CTZ4_9CILI|nr:hypothetical protein SteCoe_4719 [Stentor coeruleus]